MNSHIQAIGIDGCRSGWIAVWITNRWKRGFAIFPRVESILDLNAEMRMIDIPIGLPRKGNRTCDEGAQTLLGRNGRSRVFLGARRSFFGYLPDDRSKFRVAHRRLNRTLPKGQRVSLQLFGILPKIAEVDAVMTASRQESLRETHPELVFQNLFGRSLPKKTSPEGQRIRCDVVARYGFQDIEDWIEKLRGTGAKADDLLDACACCIAAQRTLKSRVQTVNGSDQIDSKGLRMEICY